VRGVEAAAHGKVQDHGDHRDHADDLSHGMPRGRGSLPGRVLLVVIIGGTPPPTQARFLGVAPSPRLAFPTALRFRRASRRRSRRSGRS
jgi:hypothetical protein